MQQDKRSYSIQKYYFAFFYWKDNVGMIKYDLHQPYKHILTTNTYLHLNLHLLWKWTTMA